MNDSSESGHSPPDLSRESSGRFQPEGRGRLRLLPDFTTLRFHRTGLCEFDGAYLPVRVKVTGNQADANVIQNGNSDEFAVSCRSW